MNAERETAPLIRAWLQQRSAARPDPRPLLADVFAQVATTPQRHQRWPGRWLALRMPDLRRTAPTRSFAVLGAALAVGLIGSLVVLQVGSGPARNPNDLGNPPAVAPPPTPAPASPSPTPSLTPPLPTPTPSRSDGPIDTTGWVTFSSARYGFSAGHPPDWREVGSTIDWTQGPTQDVQGGSPHYPTFDQFLAPGDHPDFNGHAMRLPAGIAKDDWTATYAASMVPYCYPSKDRWEQTVVDGHPGWIAYGECFNYAETIVFVGDYVYVFTVEDTSPPADPRLLKAFLSTVRFDSELASPAPSSARTGGASHDPGIVSASRSDRADRGREGGSSNDSHSTAAPHPVPGHPRHRRRARRRKLDERCGRGPEHRRPMEQDRRGHGRRFGRVPDRRSRVHGVHRGTRSTTRSSRSRAATSPTARPSRVRRGRRPTPPSWRPPTRRSSTRSRGVPRHSVRPTPPLSRRSPTDRPRPMGSPSGTWRHRPSSPCAPATGGRRRSARPPRFPSLPPGPGVWRLTPPAYAAPQTPWVATVTPVRAERRSVPSRPALGPHEQGLGGRLQRDQELRAGSRAPPGPSEQTAIARFWTANVIRQYNRLVRDIADARSLGLLQTARLAAMVNVVGADARISVMNAKYHYLFWRPVTAIDPTSVKPAGDGFGPVPGFDDGNAATIEATGWRPLIATPNHPEYSGRARVAHLGDGRSDRRIPRDEQDRHRHPRLLRGGSRRKPRCGPPLRPRERPAGRDHRRSALGGPALSRLERRRREPRSQRREVRPSLGFPARSLTTRPLGGGPLDDTQRVSPLIDRRGGRAHTPRTGDR